MSEHDPERICRNCRWWEKDWGVFTATGWTGMGRDDGDCNYEPRPIRKSGKSYCHHWESRHGSVR